MIIGKNRRRQTFKKAAITGTVAAAAGYVAGLLTAPQSGKDTREDIKSAADRSRSEAVKDLKGLHTDLDKIIKDAKDGSGKLSKKAQAEATELVAKAKDAKDKSAEVLGAVRAGTAEDQDLNKAIKQANTAIKNLRKYLQK